MPMKTSQQHAPSSNVRHVEIGPDRDGQRLDNCLLTLLKGVPRSLIYRLLRSGQVRVNGGRCKPGRRLQTGDVVRIPPVRQASRDHPTTPDAGDLQRVVAAIVYEDRDFLVIDKPAGLASHGGSGVRHGVIELLRHARPGDSLELAHRLDRDTSGIMVLARRRAALIALQELIRERKVVKQYLALLAGCPGDAKFDVNAPLARQGGAGGERKMQVREGGKPSLTFFKQVQKFSGSSLHEVTLATGRTHQIRVHAAHVGHPLAGDDKYAPRDQLRAFRELGLRRLFLHASRFEFDWRERGYSFSAPLPEDLSAVLDRL